MLLQVNGLVKRFGGLIAVNHLDLEVKSGEILGLIGPNGSGKTTAFNLITSFLAPDEGTVRLEGRDITGLPTHRVCRLGIARTFQTVKPFGGLTVVQNVEVAARYGRDPVQSRAAVRQRCMDALRFVDLDRDADLPARSLTLVKRKRLELARALAANPKLLLLDELMAGLNPIEQDRVIRLIQRIRRSGITIVMVEHIMRVVVELCERVIVLNTGEKIDEGPPVETLRNPAVVEAYLGEAARA